VNHHERRARAAKVQLLVAEIDRGAEAGGLDPHTDAGAVVALLSDTWASPQWARLAVCLGKRPPSAETIKAVIAVYAARAEAVPEQADPFVRCG
jgi:hypothetical protein